MTERRCISISAFWRNDQDDGFCIEMHENSQQSLDQAIEQIDQFVLHVAENDPHKDGDKINEYFKWVARVRPENQIEQVKALAMVAYAEEQGILKSDEYNGVVYIYKTNDDVCMVQRKDHKPF